VKYKFIGQLSSKGKIELPTPQPTSKRCLGYSPSILGVYNIKKS
jgi:hypothetical protein